jgi:hypothetical protein
MSTRRMHTVHLVEAVGTTRRMVGRDVPVIRCTFTSDCLPAVKRPDYQREELTTDKQRALFEALDPKGSGVPDAILLNVREYDIDWVGAGVAILTTPDIFVVDGLQRTSAGKRRIAQGLQTIDLPADLLLGMNREEEFRAFWQIGRDQTRLATQVLLRSVDSVAVCQELRKMAANTPGFPEVLWSQQGFSKDKITGHQLYELAAVLHGYAQGLTIEAILDGLGDLTELIGTKLIVHNVKYLIQLVDELYAGSLTHTFTRRVGFLRGLALFLRSYEEFWDKDGSLLVHATKKTRFKTLKAENILTALRRNNGGGAMLELLETHFGKYRPGPRALTPRVATPRQQ